MSDQSTAVVVTVSDSVAAGTREDASGPAVAARLVELGWHCDRSVVPDETDKIRSHLVELSASGRYQAIFTTGGTGIAPRDVTPEATRDVVEREIPGVAELMRADGLRFTPRSVLSRGIAGIVGATLIINLPGSPKGAVQSLGSIAHLLPHMVDLLNGRTAHDGAGETTENPRTSLE